MYFKQFFSLNKDYDLITYVFVDFFKIKWLFYAASELKQNFNRFISNQ